MATWPWPRGAFATTARWRTRPPLPDLCAGAEDSEALAELFERSQRSVYCHTAGHTLPSNRAVMAATLRFLAAQRAAG